MQASIDDIVEGVLVASGDTAEDRVLLIEDVIDFVGCIDLPVVRWSAEVVSGCVEAVADSEIVGQRSAAEKRLLRGVEANVKRVICHYVVGAECRIHRDDRVSARVHRGAVANGAART